MMGPIAKPTLEANSRTWEHMSAVSTLSEIAVSQDTVQSAAHYAYFRSDFTYSMLIEIKALMKGFR